MIALLEQSDALVANVQEVFQRYLLSEIDWQSRLIGIKGARGTGKTTMLLQKLKQQGLPASKAAYFTLDDLYFLNNTLVETGKKFYKQGGQILVLDEVHKYPRWAREIKNLYDLYPDLQIIFTGSSVIDIAKQEGDLSRRVVMYELPGLSYREYLNFEKGMALNTYSLEGLLNPEQSLRLFFPAYFRPLEHFRDYLQHGYYPFYKASLDTYHRQLQQLVRTVVEYDMAELKGFDIRNAKKMLQLLYIIAQNVPFKPNLSKLAERSNIHRNSMANYLHFLEQARLTGLLYPAGMSTATLQRPEKIFLNNPNLLHALSAQSPSPGTVREVFFYSQVQPRHNLSHPQNGDFYVDDQYVFEVGEKHKNRKQIKGQENAWVVKDDLEYPAGNAIPIWLFGLLY